MPQRGVPHRLAAPPRSSFSRCSSSSSCSTGSSRSRWNERLYSQNGTSSELVPKRGHGEVVSIDARDPIRPRRIPSPLPPVPGNDQGPSQPAVSDRQIRLTPVTLLLVLIVGY